MCILHWASNIWQDQEKNIFMAKEILQVKVYQLKTPVFLLELLIKSYNILTQYSRIRNLKTGTF